MQKLEIGHRKKKIVNCLHEKKKKIVKFVDRLLKKNLKIRLCITEKNPEIFQLGMGKTPWILLVRCELKWQDLPKVRKNNTKFGNWLQGEKNHKNCQSIARKKIANLAIQSQRNVMKFVVCGKKFRKFIQWLHLTFPSPRIVPITRGNKFGNLPCLQLCEKPPWKFVDW